METGEEYLLVKDIGKEGIKMKNSRKMLLVFGAAMTMALAGCGSDNKAAEVTPTPVPTATPTAVPATVTPAPTATPAPRVIGVKTSQSKFIYLTNSLGTTLREIYVRESGTEDWGKNLIPSESIVQDAEQVQMYYSSGSASTNDSSSGDTSSDQSASAGSSLYDMKIVTAEGDAYEIYSIETDDMEKASLTMDQDSGVAYLRYMSLASNSEKDTRDNSQQTGYSSDSGDSSDDYYDDSSDDYYDDSSDDYYDDSSDDYYDDSSDDYYDDSSDDYYDDSSDDYYDDSSDDYYDDSSDDYYDDSSDDYYDDSSDDYYDDGSDDSYVDAGGDGDSDDGADYVDEGEIPWDYE